MSTSTAKQAQPLELTAPEKLNDLHDLSEFDCKEQSINDFLQRKARKAQADKHAVIYVSCLKGTNIVVAYYTLSSGSVAREFVVPKSHQRNSPAEHPITLLGRMGVSSTAQGQGFSLDLLKDAIERAIGAAQTVASSAIVVHPLNDRLAEFYAKHAGFVACPALSPVTMMLSLR